MLECVASKPKTLYNSLTWDISFILSYTSFQQLLPIVPIFWIFPELWIIHPCQIIPECGIWVWYLAPLPELFLLSPALHLVRARARTHTHTIINKVFLAIWTVFSTITWFIFHYQLSFRWWVHYIIPSFQRLLLKLHIPSN